MEELNKNAARQFANATIENLILDGLPFIVANAQRQDIEEAFLQLVAEGVILVAEDGLVIIPNKRAAEISLAPMN
jgi:hypothetical protein